MFLPTKSQLMNHKPNIWFELAGEKPIKELKGNL